jgi:hypothetical protein
MRPLFFAVVTLAVSAAPAVAQKTTRITHDGYYSYTITVENGLRVWRPLTASDRVIVNPDGKTPLKLTFSEHRHKVISRHYHTHRYDAGAAPSHVSGPATYFYGHRQPHRRGHHGLRGAYKPVYFVPAPPRRSGKH